MKNTLVTEDIFSPKIKDTSLALGFFDGIHKGHKKVLSDAINLSKKLGTKSTVLTFKNHPVELLYGVEPEFITTAEERLGIFKEMGFDAVIMADFTPELAKLTSSEYFEKILKPLNPKSITIGYNHKFGAKQSGDAEFLKTLAKEHDFIVSVIDPIKLKNEVTSSTLIRNSIKNGQVDKAQVLLEKPYSVKNVVVKGAQRGRLIDFPTANLTFPEKKIIPKLGVYRGNAIVGSKTYRAIANIGLRPTFGDLEVPLIEVHILDFNKNVYGEVLEFQFLDKIRDEMKFSSVEKLKEQIEKDVALAKL